MNITPPNLSRLHALRQRVAAAADELAVARERFQRLAQRKENGTAPRPVVAHQLFQTPETLAARLVALLGPLDGKAVLEPSAGCGRLVRELLKAGAAEVTAVDVSPDCVEVVRPLVTTAIHADFLATTPASLGMFDAIAMNPPFTRKADIAHIKHAMQFLFPGGKLAGLCFGTDHRREVLRPLVAEWHEIPAGTFRKEGTDVPTFLFLINK
jgi:predicted RNA methylase